MDRDVSNQLDELEAGWRLREREWARKLGRLHLGAEPIEEQLARYRRVTWALSVVPGIMALMFMTLFSVFGRPDVGLIVVAVVFVPMIVFSWLDYKRLEQLAARYLKERAAFEDQRRRQLQSPLETTTSP
jgi:hypothetical protein